MGSTTSGLGPAATSGTIKARVPSGGRPGFGEVGFITQQLFDARLKANDYVVEHLKQIITIASATLALTVTFLKDIVGNSGKDAEWGWLLPLSWVCLGITVIVSAIGIGFLVENLDVPDTSESTKKGKEGLIKAFGAGAKIELVVLEWIAIGGFVVGLAALALFASLNFRSFLNRKPPEPAQSVVQVPGSNRYNMVPDPDHVGANGKKHSHTFLVDQKTGTVWNIVCQKDGTVEFKKVKVEGPMPAETDKPVVPAAK